MGRSAWATQFVPAHDGGFALLFHTTKDRELVFSTTSERDGVWREALLFVALAKLGQIFGLIAEMRFWAAIPGSLPAPFDRMGLTPLAQLGADVWQFCDNCDGRGWYVDRHGYSAHCETCDGVGKTGEPTRVDETLAVLADWRMERGVPWRSPGPGVEGVVQNLRVLGPRCATEGCEHVAQQVRVRISFQGRDVSHGSTFWREHCSACEETYELKRVADLGLFPNVFSGMTASAIHEMIDDVLNYPPNDRGDVLSHYLARRIADLYGVSRDEPVVYDSDPEIRYTRQWPWIPPPDDEP